MTTLRIALIGMGRMGRAIERLAGERDATVVARISAGQPVTRESLSGANVAIEFTMPRAAMSNIRACVAAACPVVVGTTGWYEELPALRDEIRVSNVPIVVAPNFSVGVAIFDRVVAEAGRLYRDIAGVDAHIVETHHTAKKDAPSGTAGVLARSVEGTLGRAVPITSVRVGSVPGTHEIIFDAPFEQVRLVHEARDRRVFAEGAIAAARWLVGREGGRVYGMQDVISMSSPEGG